MVPRGRRGGGPIHDEMAHRGEVEKGWLRHAAENAKSSDKSKPGGRGGGGAAVPQQLAVDECRNEMVHRAERLSRLLSGTCATTVLLIVQP